jgi:hypothetical protein
VAGTRPQEEEKVTMTLAPSGRASYRWLTITLAVIAGMYGWYAIGQYGRLNDLNQRQLSNAGAELKAAVDTAVETVTRFNNKRAEWETRRSDNPADPQISGDEPKLCDFDDNQPYLDVDGCAGIASPIPRGASGAVVQTFTDPTFGVKVTDTAGNDAVRYRFRTDRLLRELAWPDSFALIFIATDKGDVLYQDAPAQRLWLRHLRWGEQTFRDAQADRPPVLQIRNMLQLLGGSAETWDRLRSVSTRTAVQIGGTAHQLYLQPLLLDHGQRTGLVIGGAVPTETIVTDALALDSSLVAVLTFLLLLGVIGFPFVKLTALAARERFGLWDINLLYLSTGALLVLMTCGSLAVDGYFRWRATANQGLTELARDLERRVLAEVSDIRDQVADYDEMVSAMPAVDCDRWDVQTRWYTQNPESAAEHDPATASTPTKVPSPTRNIHLKQVAWIRSDGWQIWKVTSDEIPGKSLVSQRSYFRAVQHGHLFQVAAAGRPFFISADRSVSDGKFYTFLSMPSTISPALCARSGKMGGGAVVAATANLMSLDRQPLPAGYGFVLLNREGRVLYHSDGRLSLRENFFDELSEGAAVRSMLYSNREDIVESRYRERPHSLYLHRLGLYRAGEQDPGGLYVVTFRNTAAERALVGHVFTTGLIVPMAIFIVLYGAGLLALARASRSTRHHWSTWLWPHGGLNHVYRRQTAAFSALLLASAGSYYLYQSVLPFLLMPIAAAAAGIGIYAHGTRRPAARSPLVASGWQTSSILLVLVCLIIAPSAALFRLNLSHEFARLILTEREWFDSQADDMLHAAAESLTDEYAPSQVERLARARQVYLGCLPAPFDAADPRRSLPAPSKPRQSDVQQTSNHDIPRAPAPAVEVRRSPKRCGRPADFAPGDDAHAAAMLQPIGMGTVAISWLHAVNRFVPPIRNEVLERQQFQPREFAYSPDGTVIAPLRASGIAFAGFAFTLGLVVWWIRWNTTRVFRADRDAGSSEAVAAQPFEETWSTRSTDEQMVLLQIARDHVANPHQTEVIDQLLHDGLLRFEPDLRPFSADFGAFLQRKWRELRPQLHEWEDVKSGHSWQYVRIILVASMGALGCFLIATQPSLHSSLMSIATAVAGALTAAFKVREAVMSWFTRSAGTTA